MNKVVLIGRLTKDPELRFIPQTGTAVASFTIAVDRRMPGKDGQREADFIPVVVFGKNAENTGNYMSKGKLIGVSGRIQTRSYDAKDGTKRYVTEVIADEVQFLEWGQKQSSQSENHNNSSDFYTESPSYGNNDMTPIDDGDIPF